MTMLKGIWFGYAAIGAALFVAVGCKGESTTGDEDGDDGGNGTGFCSDLAGKLNGCDMGALLEDGECEEPTELETRCTAKCLLDASCNDFRTLICSNSLTPSLEACVTGCMPPPFMCGSGETVPESFECDDYPDCIDGSDEHARCPVFSCGSGERLPESYECDGELDCIDGSDEHARCPGFSCGSGERLPESFECDGELDCIDGSDEHARCPRVTCADGTTVSGARCDDYVDCFDYSDEPASCPPSAEEQICGIE
jgi:hypothetical protein